MEPHLHTRRLLRLFITALAGLVLAIWVSVYAESAHVQNVGSLEPSWLQEAAKAPEDSADEASLSRVQALLGKQPASINLGVRDKTAGCAVAGALPDADCSPGAVFADAPTSTICVAGYTKTVRSVSASLKKKVYAEYTIAYPQPTGSYEADHIIPLELGGNNDIANLYPEAASPPPGFKEKDVVEDYLHNEVCAGDLNLVQAQEQIAQDWLLVYQALDPATVKEIKSKYHSWAD